MTDENINKTRYNTYNAMSREGLMLGIPVIPSLILQATFITFAFLGFAIESWLVALVVPSLAFAFWLFLRFKCELDSRAMTHMAWDAKGAWLKVKLSSSVTTLSTPMNANKIREEKVYEYFKQIS